MGQVHCHLESLTTNYLPAKTGLEVTMIKATYKRECLIELIVPEG